MVMFGDQKTLTSLLKMTLKHRFQGWDTTGAVVNWSAMRLLHCYISSTTQQFHKHYSLCLTWITVLANILKHISLHLTYKCLVPLYQTKLNTLLTWINGQSSVTQNECDFLCT